MKPYNFNSLIRSAARRIWMWSPMRKEAIRNARLPGSPYRVGCTKCGVAMRESVKPPLFAVDHIIPASEPAALIHSWDDFFKRLNVSAESGLQILCHPCHAIKTEAEKAVRVQFRSVSKTKRARKSK